MLKISFFTDSLTGTPSDFVFHLLNALLLFHPEKNLFYDLLRGGETPATNGGWTTVTFKTLVLFSGQVPRAIN